MARSAETVGRGALGHSEETAMDDQLKALMDYTKFHIGLYTTLCTLLIAVMGLDRLKGQGQHLFRYLLVCLICFAIAGMFGGLVGSSLPRFKTWTDYSKTKLGPWFLPNLIPAPAVASAEHTAFWAGTLVALWGVIAVYWGAIPA
jgi:hypothetical protein